MSARNWPQCIDHYHYNQTEGKRNTRVCDKASRFLMVGGFGPACCAIEGFSRNLAIELGAHGIRVINIRSAGSPDSRPFQDAMAHGGKVVQEFIHKLEEDTMLKQLPMMVDVANVAVFLASNMAGKITGVTVDVTAGTTNGLNYKIPSIPFVN